MLQVSIKIFIFAQLYARFVPIRVLCVNTDKMTHKELMNEVQKRCGMDKHQCAMLLSAFQHVLVKEAIELHPVQLDGLGTFAASKHPEYVAEDPETGNVVMYPPRYSYRFQSTIQL